MTQTVSQALATQDNSPAGLIKQYRGDFATVLPSHINADQWIRITTGVLRRNQQLATVAKRNPGSFLAAVLDAARLGLEVGDTYHLVPFGNEIVGIADYTGLLELAYRSGAVSSIRVEVVHANDEFRYEPGAMDRPEHRPDWFGNRGEMLGAYAYAVLKDGVVSQVVVRSKHEIEEVRDKARGAGTKESPWRTWPDRMWRKTVLRELMKFIPTSAEFIREQARALAEAGRTAERIGSPPPASDDTIDGVFVEEWPDVATPGGELP